MLIIVLGLLVIGVLYAFGEGLAVAIIDSVYPNALQEIK
jgi:hypothetical protein